MVGVRLKDEIAAGNATLAVIGLGYVGVPLAAAAARSGMKVTGLDLNARLVSELKRGRHESRDVSRSELLALMREGLLRITDDPADLKGCDVFCICVPTPLTPQREPVLDHIHQASEMIAEALAGHRSRESLVILESTSFPGTTHEEVLPRLLRSGASLCRHFHLAFSPERIDPGNPAWNISNTPKLVGGERRCCTATAAAFYRRFVENVVPVSSPAAAEMAKVLENVYRAVNIALVNELWMLCERMGLDVWEVIEAASTKPFGFQAFRPGPGLGGHCIPVDPFYLAYKAREFDFQTEFVELAGKINASMPYFVVDLIRRTLDRRGLALRGSRILLLGMSYKAGVGDTRNSPSLKVLKLLRDSGARVSYHDPYVPEIAVEGKVLRSVPLTPSRLRSTDLAVILTDHPTVDYDGLRESGVDLVDTRNVLGERRGAP